MDDKKENRDVQRNVWMTKDLYDKVMERAGILPFSTVTRSLLQLFADGKIEIEEVLYSESEAE